MNLKKMFVAWVKKALNCSKHLLLTRNHSDLKLLLSGFKSSRVPEGCYGENEVSGWLKQNEAFHYLQTSAIMVVEWKASRQ